MIGTVLENVQKRATPEARERMARLRRASDHAPSAEREEARAEIAMAVHGLIAAAWQCECGQGYSYPSSVCPCTRPYPRRCITPSCGRVSESEMGATLGGVTGWRVAAQCAHCHTDLGRQSRAHTFATSSIPPRERLAAPRIVAYPDQAEALRAIDEWVAMGPLSRVWKRDQRDREQHRGGTCMLYLGGRPGRGKSVLAAHAIHRAFVDEALVQGFRWHSQASLAQLFQERFARDSDRAREHADRALGEWRAVTECPLLVIDDLFAQSLTPAFGEALSTLLRERLDHVRPTVVTSNVRPSWAVYFEADVGRLDSRWAAFGRELTLGGKDLRRGVA